MPCKVFLSVVEHLCPPVWKDLLWGRDRVRGIGRLGSSLAGCAAGGIPCSRRPDRQIPAGAGPRVTCGLPATGTAPLRCARTARWRSLQSTEGRITALRAAPLRGSPDTTFCPLLRARCVVCPCATADRKRPVAPVLSARLWRPVRHTDQVRRPTARIQRVRSPNIRCPLPLLVCWG